MADLRNDDASVVEVDDRFDMSHDDSEGDDFEDVQDNNDGFDMSHDDDDEDSVTQAVEDLLTLDNIALTIETYRATNNLNFPSLRHLLFEQTLRPLATQKGAIYDNLVLSSNESDVAYNVLMENLYPSLKPYLTKVNDDSMRDLLLQLLIQALDLTLQIEKPQNVVPNPEQSTAPEAVSTDEEDDDEDDIMDDPELITTTMKILEVYKDLFEVGFELVKPKGVLTKEGILGVNKGKTRLYKASSFNVLYDLINVQSDKFIVQSEITEKVALSDLRNVKMRKGTTYYPEFQLGNLLGELGNIKVDTWSDLEKALKPEIMANVANNLKDGKDTVQILESLTTCIVVSEFDANSVIKLRINIGNKNMTASNFTSLYNSSKNSIFSGIGDLRHVHQLRSGILEVTIVLNEAAYNGRPLFAYEAIQNLNARGRRPSIKSMILGQNTSGKILTANLDTQQACILLIGAGQRSGKGVLTLNLLGTVLANGSPMIYMDGKPDMAPVLWDVGKKYGVDPASWDVFDHNENAIGHGAPPQLMVENPSMFGIFVYLKMLHLMMIAATLQSKGVQIGDGKRPFFIFDEALAVQQGINSSFAKLLSTAKNKQADPAEKDWATHVLTWAENMTSDLATVINSQLPKSGISTVWLFQNFQRDVWSQAKFKGLNGDVNPMDKAVSSSLSMKFLGKGTTNTEYALGAKGVKDHSLVARNVSGDGGRHFAKTTSQKITSIDDLEIFKPYLVLNSAENGSKSAEELKSNVTSDVLKVIAPDGSLHEGAGFEGFAKMVGDDAIQNLSKGKEYLNDLLRIIGAPHSSIDEYLYDASADSFKSMGEWVNQAENGSKQEEEESVYSAGDAFSFNEDKSTEVDINHVPNFEDTSDEDIVFANSNFDRPAPESTIEPELPQFESPVVEQPTFNLMPEPPPVTPTVEKDISFDNSVLPEENMDNFASIYQEPVVVEINPFRPGSRSDKPISSLHALNTMSEILLTEIERMVGDLSRVHVFEATATGLIINNIAFRPQFPENVIKSMPYDIRLQVERGNMVELFNFKHVSKFSNLESLHLDDIRIAEGRFRREANFSPRKTWIELFKKYRNLVELTIGGKQIVDEDTSNEYEQEEKRSYDLQEKLTEKLKVPRNLITSSHMNKVWKSRPVKIATGALGWTAGVKAVAVATTIFGGWGLLFGAFGAYGAYKTHKSRKER